MANFLLTYTAQAIVTTPTMTGRRDADDDAFSEAKPPTQSFELCFYSIMTAENEDQVRANVVQHKYPGFTSQLTKILELPENVNSTELAALMPYKNIIRE